MPFGAGTHVTTSQERVGSRGSLHLPSDAQVRSWPIAATQASVCSDISRESSTSIPKYRTVLSSLLWPRRICTALRALGPTADQRRFGPAHGVRPIAGTVESNLAYPSMRANWRVDRCGAVATDRS